MVVVAAPLSPRRTASRALPEPTVDVDTIGDAAVGLLDRFDPTRAVRLIAVRLEMTPPE